MEILPDTPPNHTTVAKNKVPAPDITSDTVEATSEDAMSKETLSDETAPEETVTRKRIEITGIRDLPRANWYLCNNSFLVHGFFNYHYLLLKTVETGDKKRLFLGVPGIYEQPERVMALTVPHGQIRLFPAGEYLVHYQVPHMQQYDAYSVP